MPVRFAEGPPGHAALDVSKALQEAEAAGDQAGVKTIMDLLGGHLQEDLACLSRPELERFLRGRQIWREHGVHPVFKTAGAPCFAYTALDQGDELAVTVLGCCYRYPGSQQAWWEQVILPRLRRYV